MDTIDVKLTVSRGGPGGTQTRGDTVPVSLLEAGRLLRQNAIETPDAKALKAIAAAEERAATETASAALESAPAEGKPKDAEGSAPAGE